MLDFLFGTDETVKEDKTEKSNVKPKNDEFKVLSAKEQILIRPGMYIGSTSYELQETWLNGQLQSVAYVAGLVKCANELIDNSVDEAIRTKFAFANKINVSVSGNTFTIEDNGRGIPQDEVSTPEGKIVLRPEAAWTLVNSSSNYVDDRETIGMNGVGSSLANYFSSIFIGETGDGSNTMIVNCRDNCDVVNVASQKSKWRGTKVTFVPDFKHFECDSVDDNTIEVLKERVRSLAMVYPEIEFRFNGTKMDNKFRKYAASYSEKNITVEQNGMSFMFATTDQGFRQNSFVNGVQTKVGGVHVNTVFEKLADELIPMVKRKHKIEINRARIKECATIVMIMRGFKDPKFDSQTKERLTNTAGEINSHIGELNYNSLARKVMNDEAIIMPIIESALARKLAAEKAAQTKAAKKAKKAAVAKHVKAGGLNNMLVKTTLFLTEGDSAIGYLLKVRDPETQGGYPLRGKVLNTWDLSPNKVLANKELFEIMSILNLTIGEKADNMTYDYVSIMTDADVDGTGSIYPLLIAFFYKYWPELLEEGRILFCKTPIKISTNNKEVVWCYSEEEFHNHKFTGKWDHRHIKGLGSLTEDEYERVIKHPVFDVIEVDGESKELLEMLFGDDPDKRKAWMNG